MIALLVVLGLLAAYVDWHTHLIPNWVSLVVALLGVVLQLVRASRAITPYLYNALSVMPFTGHIANLLSNPFITLALALAVLGFGALIESAWRHLRGKMGMGFGDIKYIAAWTCTLGFWVFPALVIACVLAIVYSLLYKRESFAFAPWLSLAFIAVLLLLLFAPNMQPVLV